MCAGGVANEGGVGRMMQPGSQAAGTAAGRVGVSSQLPAPHHHPQPHPQPQAPTTTPTSTPTTLPSARAALLPRPRPDPPRQGAVQVGRLVALARAAGGGAGADVGDGGQVGRQAGHHAGARAALVRRRGGWPGASADITTVGLNSSMLVAAAARGAKGTHQAPTASVLHPLTLLLRPCPPHTTTTTRSTTSTTCRSPWAVLAGGSAPLRHRSKPQGSACLE